MLVNLLLNGVFYNN